MKDKSPAFQWYPKQYLGDDKVLAMDWDAKGMHHWLLNLSWQQQPAGSIPDDMALIRRWLGLPQGKPEWCQQKEIGNSYLAGCHCPECLWRRVKPQIFSAWTLTDGRWVNAGMVRAWMRQQTYKQNGSKKKAKHKQHHEVEDEDVIKQKHISRESPPENSDKTIQDIANMHPKLAKPFETERAIVEQLDRLGDEMGVRNALNYLLGQTRKYRELWEKWPKDKQEFSPESPRWFASRCYAEPEKNWADKAAGPHGVDADGGHFEGNVYVTQDGKRLPGYIPPPKAKGTKA